MALIDDFKARFPEFDSSEVDAAWSGLEASWPCLYGGTYGSSTCDDEAILNLIAHLFIVNAAGSGPAMTASSQSVGNVSVTNVVDVNMSDRQSFLNTTRYGQQFALMTKNRHGAHFV